MAQKHTIVRQAWSEYERGWGKRPDGHTLHLTKADRDAYEAEYIAKHHTSAEAPDEYSQMDGAPTLYDVDQELYDLVKASKHGITETEITIREMKEREREREANATLAASRASEHPPSHRVVADEPECIECAGCGKAVEDGNVCPVCIHVVRRRWRIKRNAGGTPSKPREIFYVETDANGVSSWSSTEYATFETEEEAMEAGRKLGNCRIVPVAYKQTRKAKKRSPKAYTPDQLKLVDLRRKLKDVRHALARSQADASELFDLAKRRVEESNELRIHRDALLAEANNAAATSTSLTVPTTHLALLASLLEEHMKGIPYGQWKLNLQSTRIFFASRGEASTPTNIQSNVDCAKRETEERTKIRTAELEALKLDIASIGKLSADTFERYQAVQARLKDTEAGRDTLSHELNKARDERDARPKGFTRGHARTFCGMVEYEEYKARTSAGKAMFDQVVGLLNDFANEE